MGLDGTRVDADLRAPTEIKMRKASLFIIVVANIDRPDNIV